MAIVKPSGAAPAKSMTAPGWRWSVRDIGTLGLGSVHALVWSQDGHYLAAASSGNAWIGVWETATWKQLWSAKKTAGRETPNSVALAPDGQNLIACSLSQDPLGSRTMALLYNGKTGEFIRAFNAADAIIKYYYAADVFLSRDGKRALFGIVGEPGGCLIYDTASWENAKINLNYHGTAVDKEDKNISGGKDSIYRINNTANSSSLPNYNLVYVTFFYDEMITIEKLLVPNPGSLIKPRRKVTLGYNQTKDEPQSDKIVRVFDLDTGFLLKAFPTSPFRFNRWAKLVGMSFDASLVAAAFEGGEFMIWDYDSEKMVHWETYRTSETSGLFAFQDLDSFAFDPQANRLAYAVQNRIMIGSVEKE